MDQPGVLDAIHTCRALRRLKPDPVPDEILVQILDAAIRAPSASNTQNWAFVVIKEPGQRRKIAEIYRKAFDLMSAMYRDRQPAPHQTLSAYNRMMGAA